MKTSGDNEFDFQFGLVQLQLCVQVYLIFFLVSYILCVLFRMISLKKGRRARRRKMKQ